MKKKHKEKENKKVMRYIPYILVGIVLIIAIFLFFHINKLNNDINSLKSTLIEKETLVSQYSNRIDYMENTIKNKNQEISSTSSEYESYKVETEEVLSSALLPPYISVDDQTIYTVFKLPEDNLLEWEIPFENLNHDLQRGFFRREFVDESKIPLHTAYANYINEIQVNYANNYIDLCNKYQQYSNYYGGGDVGCSDARDFYEDEIDGTLDYFEDSLKELQEEGKQYIELDNSRGRDFVVMDFRPYVDESNFKNVMRDMYNDYSNDEDFIYDLWYMIAQLTTYSTEIEETPKYPLETLLSGGGDCEDTSILMASLLKAVPRNWDVELVYLDADNPEDPREVNHVVVYVNTGSESFFIETTSDVEMNPYEEIEGWYFEI